MMHLVGHDVRKDIGKFPVGAVVVPQLPVEVVGRLFQLREQPEQRAKGAVVRHLSTFSGNRHPVNRVGIPHVSALLHISITPLAKPSGMVTMR
ncbi:MAG: hypothetical protein AB7E51_18885 [Pseudodesulfovibrio sp.]|uniref:hypothetical protein n=1 Tax=Pseudodesulfovibrio sp. TaxID=2035812 RepID=UPI003D132394